MGGKRARVVVLGGGFGGLTFCKYIDHSRADVVVVDRTNHHLFQPLLYQVAMAGLSAPDIAQPIRSILSRKPNLHVLMDEAMSVDLVSRRLHCRNATLDYDYLVLAPGSVTSYFGHPEWAEFAPGMKTLEDALLIRRNVLLAFEHAESSSDPKEQARLMTIVIVGGGPTGVELAGACAELAHRVLKRDFDRIDPRSAKVILIEASARVLGQFQPPLSDRARLQLEKLGVQVMTSSGVKNISKGLVTLDNDDVIRAGVVVWAAGVMAHPITRALKPEVDLDRAGRIRVTPDLSIPTRPEAFAVGDCVSLLQADIEPRRLNQAGGRPVPGVAPAAIQMARHVARMINDELRGRTTPASRPPFVYRDKGMLATIGRSAGIAQLGHIRLSGFVAWLAWLMVHLLFLIGLRNKVSVFISWAYSYFTYKLGARIITGWPEVVLSETAPGYQEAHGPPPTRHR